jgi:hypothetical protein
VATTRHRPHRLTSSNLSAPSPTNVIHKEPSVKTSIRFPRTVLKLALVSAIALAGSAQAATTTAQATASVVAPMTITKATDLVFGSFSGSAAGSVTVSTNGTRTSSGVVVFGAGTTAARFNVTGSGTATYGISFSGTSTTLTYGADSMAFATASDTSGAGAISGNATSGTLVAGAGSIYVGGVLTVAASQPAGSYSGTINATVDYN